MISSAQNWLASLGRMARNRFATQPATFTYAWQDRRAAYDLWDAYYENQVYETIANGGQRENINRALGNAAAADLTGLYNPVSSVVDLYLNVFGGAFGDEIVIEPEEQATQALVDAVAQIWRWSNLNIEKQPLCRLPACHGVCGLRIVAVDDPDPKRRRVYLKPEHPRIIRDVEVDTRGNVVAIQLEYDQTTGLAENAVTETIREEMDKDEFRIYDLTSGAPVLRESRPNLLGVVPYVLLRHEYDGGIWGKNAFYRARAPLDRLNALLSHIDVQIHRHVVAKWLLAASGEPPQEFDMTDMSLVWVNTKNAAGTPVLQQMVANLDLGGALAQAQAQLAIIEDMLPELKATQGKYLSGQSGETIAQLRRPAEDRLLLARANYEDALIRAQQIAASWGVLLGLWDLGTGTGTREAADRAFNEGFESHKFNKRPAFSEDMTSATQQTEAPGRPEQAQDGQQWDEEGQGTTEARREAQRPVDRRNGQGVRI